MKKLDKKAVWLFFLQYVWSFVYLGAFVVAITLSALDGEISVMAVLNLIGWVLLTVLLVSYFVSHLAYKFYLYELSNIGFKKESGIIWKQYVTIPYDRIQNVDIYRGVLARILGLSDLQIHTAGVGGVAMGEGRLPGLSMADAEVMRDELINRSRQSRSGQGL